MSAVKKEEIQVKYTLYKNELSSILQKISELESEKEEHQYTLT
jgi:hypothetical protein